MGAPAAPVLPGQEITNSYQPGVIHRPDMSLYIYGVPGCFLRRTWMSSVHAEPPCSHIIHVNLSSLPLTRLCGAHGCTVSTAPMLHPQALRCPGGARCLWSLPA